MILTNLAKAHLCSPPPSADIMAADIVLSLAQGGCGRSETEGRFEAAVKTPSSSHTNLVRIASSIRADMIFWE
jgi:hypothetical protein